MTELAPAAALEKPRLRGVLHQFAAAAALGAGAVLVATTTNLRAAAAAGIYAASLVTLFTVSATYHVIQWAPPARAWMRRADHASIFVLIAGTYTPIALLGLPAAEGATLLWQVWTGAVLGVLQSLFWVHAPKWVVAVLAVAVGWTLAPHFLTAFHALGAATFLTLLAGGVAYTLGALAYATKRPRLWPRTFGYHEVFHALTLVGAALHFGAVIHVVRVAAGG